MVVIIRTTSNGLFCFVEVSWSCCCTFSDKEQWHTDLLHLHDWQAALCAVYYRTCITCDPY